MQTVKQLPKLVAKIMPTVIVFAILGAVWLCVHQIQSINDNPEEIVFIEAATLQESEVVQLAEGKAKVAQIQTETVTLQNVQHVHIVPGRIQYDAAKHIEIKAPTDGMIQKLFVKPGDTVQKGQLLAMIMSPQVGRARAEVLQAQSELALEEKAFDRETQIAGNLQHLLAMISSGKTINTIQEKLAGATLGMYREQILSAYSTFLLKLELRNSAKSVASSGAIPGRVLKQRESELEIAKSAYRSIMDETAFIVKQSKQKSQIRVDNAQRQLKITTQQLETLLGYSEKIMTNVSAQKLSQLELKAPFSGTIEERAFAANERVKQADSIFVLADTAELYVVADIRENDWAAIGVKQEQSVDVYVPALSESPLTATIYYVGRVVDEKTNAVPLVAKLKNEKKLLRPGMFVRVSIPLGKKKKTLAVPPSAVSHHEAEHFVFVAIAENTYQRVNVETGLISNDWIEISSGLSPGQKVVDEGVFLLQSELLLEGEE